MGRYASGISKRAAKPVFDETVEQLKLTPCLDLPYYKLSGGQKQRVQLARVVFQLIADKNRNTERWLLLDEHTAHLDIYQQYQSFSFIRRLLKNHNVGLIASVHDIHLAASFADLALLIHQGQKIHAGALKDVLVSPEFFDCFKIRVRIESN